MSRRRNRILIKVQKPNKNKTMTMGNKVVVDAIFNETGLNEKLNSLKRCQGEMISDETKALVANSIEMTGLSIRRLDRVLDDEIVRKEYGLGDSAPSSIYRTVKRLGENVDGIIMFLAESLKQKYGIEFETVFIDWTSMYFEAPQKGIVRVGYSRDHRPDRPQVTVGIAIDKNTRMPIGLTINPGNVVDVTHFLDTFEQIRPFLKKDTMIIFDNGAYSKENAEILEEAGFGFLSRQQLNKTDDKFVRNNADKWIEIDENMSFLFREGNKNRYRYVFRNMNLFNDTMKRYRRKAERDYDQMIEMKEALSKGKNPRKKDRNPNCFVSTHFSYQFPLTGLSREEAIEEAIRRMITGREGLFALITNRPLTAIEALEYYRSRNDVETAFRDLKHGIDWRPARCTNEFSIKGRILISFLALFCMSMIRFLYPQFRDKTAESLSEELCSFSLTVFFRKNGNEERVWSNYGPIIRAIYDEKSTVIPPSTPEQTIIDNY